MKNLFIAVVCLFMASTANAQYTSGRLEAVGLTCALCTKAINNSLETLPFIESVDVDIATTSFVFKFKEGGKINIDQIKNAVEDAGFSVGKLFLTRNFDNVTVKNDQHITINGETFHFLKSKNQTINGLQEFQVVDKNFVTAKAFQSIAKSSSKECVKTGKAASCCGDETTANQRVYHITI